MNRQTFTFATCDLAADLELALCELERAVEFRDQCLQRPLECEGTGTLRDAREWLDSVASEIVRIRLDMDTARKLAQVRTTGGAL